MRGLFEATVILAAPVLAFPRPSTSASQGTSHALIKLDVSPEDVFIQETFLQFDVLESEAACGYGNITLDGHTLFQNETGFGSGSLVTEQGNLVIADWAFTCVGLDNGHQEQQIQFDVIYIDETKVHDVGFSMRFRQVAPVAITSIHGAEHLIGVPEPAPEGGDVSGPTTLAGLDDELAILEMMKLQLTQLERAIARKEQYISGRFNIHSSSGDISDHTQCDGLGCVAKSILKNVQEMANRVNSQHDHPPLFCQCEPALNNHKDSKRPTTLPPEHGVADAPPHLFPFLDEPSPSPVDEDIDELENLLQETASDFNEPPGFLNINNQERPLHAVAEDEDDEDDEPTLLDLPPPPPPYDDELDTDVPKIAGTTFTTRLPAVLIIMGLMIIGVVYRRCVLSARAREPRHRRSCRRGRASREKRAARHAAIRAIFLALGHRLLEGARAWCEHKWRQQQEQRQQQQGWPWWRRRCLVDEEKGVAATAAAPAAATCGGSGGGGGDGGDGGGTPLRHSPAPPPHHHFPAYGALEEEEEEEAEPRRINSPCSRDSFSRDGSGGSSGDESDDALSITMEQELAQFRAVAGVVGDLVVATEGRRNRAAAAAAATAAAADTYHGYNNNNNNNNNNTYARAQGWAPPSSRASAFPDYHHYHHHHASPTDEEEYYEEALPPYDEGPGDPRFIVDGFMYTPGSAAYTPPDRDSSLDEHLSWMG